MGLLTKKKPAQRQEFEADTLQHLDVPGLVINADNSPTDVKAMERHRV